MSTLWPTLFLHRVNISCLLGVIEEELPHTTYLSA
jgi:hypothetical protein